MTAAQFTIAQPADDAVLVRLTGSWQMAAGLPDARPVEEILTNVARHSRATRVDIDLGVSDEQVSLDVHDNGVGIAEGELHGRKSLGLLGMHERALLFGGEVKITGAPGHGTRVAVTIPTRNRQ